MFEAIFLLYLPLAILVAITSGILGCFTLWRRLSYMGDSLSHFSVLGVTISIILNLDLNMVVISFALIYVSVLYILRNRLHNDTVIAILAHSGLALAIILAHIFNKIRIDFMSLLFGDILVTSNTDLLIFLALTIAVVCFTIFNWREIIITTLNINFAKSKSINTNRIDLFLFLSLAIYVVIAVKIIGAVLVASLLILPSACASIVSRSPQIMMIISIIISLICQISGIALSYCYDMPSGASIAIVGLVIFTLINIFALFRPCK